MAHTDTGWLTYSLRERMTRQGLTLSGLAAGSGISRRTLHRRFAAPSEWSLHELAAVARVLDCAVDDLLAARDRGSAVADLPLAIVAVVAVATAGTWAFEHAPGLWLLLLVAAIAVTSVGIQRAARPRPLTRSTPRHDRREAPRG